MYIFSHLTGPRTVMTSSDFNKAYTLSGFPASAALTSWVIFSKSLLWNTFQHLFGEDSQQLPANIQWIKDWSVLIWTYKTVKYSISTNSWGKNVVDNSLTPCQIFSINNGLRRKEDNSEFKYHGCNDINIKNKDITVEWIFNTL